ncbi:MAG: hypothetical protein ACLPWD_06080 [Methanobacterium sp.]
MEIKKYLSWLRFLSIRSLLTGKRTRRDIIIVIAVFIIIRLAVYGAMSTTGFHPISFLNHV